MQIVGFLLKLVCLYLGVGDFFGIPTFVTHPKKLHHFFAPTISDALRTQSCWSCKLQAVSKTENEKLWSFSWQFQGFVKSGFLSSKSNPRRFESAGSREIWSTSGSSEFRAGRSEEAAARRDGLRYVSGNPGELHHGYLWISPWISTWISMDIYYLQPWLSMDVTLDIYDASAKKSRESIAVPGSVLVVGAGGLGCPVALYLAAAGGSSLGSERC